MDILSDGSSGIFDVIVLCQVGFFILEAAEPALNHDVVCPATFAIHALTNAVFLYKINVLLACKLASLIRIQYLRFGYPESLFQSIYDHSGVKSVIYFPANDTAAVPINNGCQI